MSSTAEASGGIDLLALLKILMEGKKEEDLMKKDDVVGEYKFVKQLGKGAFGEVWAVEKDEELFAIKVMPFSDETIEMEVEFASHKELESPFLVKYLGLFKVTPRKLFFIVMELCAQGDLSRLLKFVDSNKDAGITISPKRLIKIFTQIILGLHVLHEHGVLHRDLKLQNIFVDEDDNVKIGDFGCSRFLKPGEDSTKTFVGTRPYICPEMFKKEAYGRGSDLWSLGVIMYQLCTLELPFAISPKLGEDVINQPLKPIPKDLYIPEQLCDIIHALLSKKASERPTTGQLLEYPIIREAAKTNGLLQFFPPPGRAPPRGTFGSPSASPSPSGPSGFRGSSPAPRAPVVGGSRTPPPPGGPAATLRVNPKGGVSIQRTMGGELCTFTINDFRTVFLAQPITSGVWRWNVQIGYAPNAPIRIGACPSNNITICDDSFLGFQNKSGSASLFIFKDRDGTLQSSLRGVKGSDNIPPQETVVPDKATVTVEVNMNTKTLIFFVDGKKVPRGISNLPPNSVHLGVTGYYKPSFTSLSLQKMTQPAGPDGVTFYNI